MTLVLSPSQRSRILGWGALLGVVGIAIWARWPSATVNDEPRPIQAKHPIKIGLVNMERVYREYHKTKEHEVELDEQKSQAKGGVDELLTIWNEWRDDFMERKDLSQATEEEATALNESSTVINTYATDRQAEITKLLEMLRAEILAELHSLVEKIASEEGYDLVFDSSGKSSLGIEMMLFSRTGIDFTDTVLAKANP